MCVLVSRKGPQCEHVSECDLCEPLFLQNSPSLKGRSIVSVLVGNEKSKSLFPREGTTLPPPQEAIPRDANSRDSHTRQKLRDIPPAVGKQTPRDVQRVRGLSVGCPGLEQLPPAMSQARGFLNPQEDHTGSQTSWACGAGHLQTAWCGRTLLWGGRLPVHLIQGPESGRGRHWAGVLRPHGGKHRAQAASAPAQDTFRIAESSGTCSVLLPLTQTWPNSPFD